MRKITALPIPRNLTLEPKYIEALNRWQLYISSTLSLTGKPQRLFYQTKRAAESAAEIFERRQKHFGRNMSQLTPSRMAIAAELSYSSAIATMSALGTRPSWLGARKSQSLQRSVRELVRRIPCG